MQSLYRETKDKIQACIFNVNAPPCSFLPANLRKNKCKLVITPTSTCSRHRLKSSWYSDTWCCHTRKSTLQTHGMYAGATCNIFNMETRSPSVAGLIVKSWKSSGWKSTWREQRKEWDSRVIRHLLEHRKGASAVRLTTAGLV